MQTVPGAQAARRTERRRRVLACSATALAVVLLPGEEALAASPVPVGEAEVVVPRVLGHAGEITRELAVGDEIHAEEVLESDVGSAARIRFRDGTELSVGPSSRVTIDRFVYDPAAGTGRLALRFVSGLFEFVSGTLNPASYDLRAPGGQLSIRGTRVVIDTGRDLVATTEGTVVVRLEAGETVTVSAGECLMGGGSGGTRVGRGSACRDALDGYRSLTAALASVPAPAPAPPAPGPARPDDDRPESLRPAVIEAAPAAPRSAPVEEAARPDRQRDRHPDRARDRHPDRHRDHAHDRHRDRDRHSGRGRDRDNGRDRDRGRDCH